MATDWNPLLRDQFHLPPAHHLWLYLPTVVLSIAAMVPLIVYAERRARLKQVFVAMVALLGVGLVRALAVLSAPVAVLKSAIALVQGFGAWRELGHMDMEERAAAKAH